MDSVSNPATNKVSSSITGQTAGSIVGTCRKFITKYFMQISSVLIILFV
ncbi:MAG: hypothetical protein PHZ11_02115 [Desulfitobacteriaceae bacterium]|nr:hypothetical protein [Desulfitobacteriaceae bacterium]